MRSPVTANQLCGTLHHASVFKYSQNLFNPVQDENDNNYLPFECKVARNPKSESKWVKLMSKGRILKPYECKAMVILIKIPCSCISSHLYQLSFAGVCACSIRVAYGQHHQVRGLVPLH